MLQALIFFNMTSSLKQNEESLAFEIKLSELGMGLLLIRKIHLEGKKLFK